MSAPRKTVETPATPLPKALAVLTTAAGRYGPCSYASGIIIEGLPAGLLDETWQNADAAAVRAARRAGAAVVRYGS